MNYKEIVLNIFEHGKEKTPVRDLENGRKLTDTIGTFCEVFRHDMSEGFPLTTLRKVPWKGIRVELEGFLRGITDKKWYQERGCHFWDEWCNPVALKEEQIQWLNHNHSSYDNYQDCVREVERFEPEFKKQINDLGPIYGYQWRSFNRQYITQITSISPTSGDGGDLKENSVDQLKRIVDTLKRNPTDRRMLCSAWNPNQIDHMALPPCHVSWYVSVLDGRLNLHWFQRSCDVALGLPANIASYGLLLELLSREAGMPAGELVGTLADCHIYKNQIEPLKKMVLRGEKPLPFLVLEEGDIFSWTWDKAKVTGYDPHPAVEMGKVEV